MKKLVIITAIISVIAVFACSRPGKATPNETPGKKATVAAQAEDTSTPIGRQQAWRKFKKEHPEQARMMMRICRENPELGCGAMMGIGPGGRGGSGRMGPMDAGEGPGGMPGRMGPGSHPGYMKGMRGGPHAAMAPEFFKKMEELRLLKQEIRKLGMEYRATSDEAKRKELDGTINKKLGQAYELKREVMHKRVEMVEQQLKLVKQELEKYENDRSGVIKAWFERVTGQTSYKEF